MEVTLSCVEFGSVCNVSLVNILQVTGGGLAVLCYMDQDVDTDKL